MSSGLMTHVARAPGDPDSPPGYSPLRTAKINRRRVAVCAFQNGAKLGYAACQGQGFADVFEEEEFASRVGLIRRAGEAAPECEVAAKKFCFDVGGWGIHHAIDHQHVADPDSQAHARNL